MVFSSARVSERSGRRDAPAELAAFVRALYCSLVRASRSSSDRASQFSRNGSGCSAAMPHFLISGIRPYSSRKHTAGSVFDARSTGAAEDPSATAATAAAATA